MAVSLSSLTCLATAFALDLTSGRAVAINGAQGAGNSSCVACHGWDGLGDVTGLMPRLAGQNSVYLFKQLQDYSSGERFNPVMSPIAAALTEEQRANVSAYFSSLVAREPPPQAPEHASPLLVRGRELARIGDGSKGVPGCDTCHAPGLENMPPEAPVLHGLSAFYTASQMRLFKTARRDNDVLERMRAFASRLSNADIEAVAAYYASVPAEPRATP